MKKKLFTAYLQFLKRIAPTKIYTRKIFAGILKDFRWTFNAKTNNEMLLGVWESEMQEIFSTHLKPGGVVYDLGAHQGFLSVVASVLVGDRGKVYSFEPFPYNHKFLKDNIELNNLKNITLFQAAVSNTMGTIRFSNSEHDTANTYLKDSPTFSDKNSFEVACVSLDALVKNNKISLPDFIKIDVEGAEFDVLQGCTEILSNSNPVVYLETHNVHNPGVDEKCLNWLAAINYSILETIAIKPERAMCSYVLTRKK